MDNKSNYKYLLSDLTTLKGVGTKTANLLKKKKINNIFDLLWKLPKSYTDRSLSSKIKDLRKIQEEKKPDHSDTNSLPLRSFTPLPRGRAPLRSYTTRSGSVTQVACAHDGRLRLGRGGRDGRAGLRRAACCAALSSRLPHPPLRHERPRRVLPAVLLLCVRHPSGRLHRLGQPLPRDGQCAALGRPAGAGGSAKAGRGSRSAASGAASAI